MTHEVRLIAAFVDQSGQIVAPPANVVDVTFELAECSALRGYAMNAGSSVDPDFDLVDDTARFSGNLAIARLNVFDYGGMAKAVARGGAYTAELLIPRDNNPSNWIPDGGWKASANGQIIGVINDDGQFSSEDADNVPEGDQRRGDGFGFYQEYRGFVAMGEHRRTNPHRKDLFISSTLEEAGIR